MAAIEDHKVYGLKVRENANDGSDFGTPDADYRFWFLGEDGRLHLKDAADAVTDITTFDKRDATAAPTVNDDSADGYHVGSRWIDTTNDKEYVCTDATVGAAVWKETTITAGAIDINGLTLERIVAPISDELAMYDASAAANRKVPPWAAAAGSSRGGFYYADECAFNSTSDVRPWNVVSNASGTNAQFTVPTGLDSNHPGVFGLSTGTTTTGRCVIGHAAESIVLGGGKLRFGVVAKIPTLSDGTNTFTVRLGLSETFAGDPTDGVQFRYIHSANSGKWLLVTRSNSVETTADSGVAADTGWHTFEFEVNAAGSSVEFFIDGVSVGTIGTNIPTGTSRATALQPVSIIKSAGATARTVEVDAWWCAGEFTTPR